MNVLAYFAYAIYVLIIIFGGLVAAFSKSIVRALTGLILTLFGAAGIYFLIAAPFLALMQISIYVGVVAVLVFFAIMLTNAEDSETGIAGISRLVLGIISASIGFVTILYAAFTYSVYSVPAQRIPLSALGEVFLSRYLVPFELISVVLLVAMVGAVALGFERRKEA